MGKRKSVARKTNKSSFNETIILINNRVQLFFILSFLFFSSDKILHGFKYNLKKIFTFNLFEAVHFKFFIDLFKHNYLIELFFEFKILLGERKISYLSEFYNLEVLKRVSIENVK